MRESVGSGAVDRALGVGAAIPLYCARLLVRLTGAIREESAWFILRKFVEAREGVPPSDLFNSGWRFIQRYRWLFRGREVRKNPYNIPWQNFALMELLVKVNKDGRRYVPRLIVENEEALLEPARRKAPIVVVTVHAGMVQFVLNRVFQERDIDSSVIAGSPHITQDRSEKLGTTGPVRVISPSVNTLLTARKDLREGRLVCACVDFFLRERGTLFHDVYIATDIFGFARRHAADIVYAVSTVSDDAAITISLARPRISSTECSDDELATDFMAFVSAVLPETGIQKVGPGALQNAASSRWRLSALCVPRFPNGRRAAVGRNDDSRKNAAQPG